MHTTRLAILLVFSLSALPLGLAGSQQKDEPDPQIAEQRKAALANWKRASEKDDPPPHLETDDLLVYGKAPGKTLEDVGPVLQKQFALAKKTLGIEKADLWPGKLTVYLVPERAEFSAFLRRVEKRRPEPDEVGSFFIRTDVPHVVGGPPRVPSDPPVEGQAGEQIAVALLTKKAGMGVPYWLVSGFGRATVTQTLPPRERASEHQRAQLLVSQKKRKAKDAWVSGLPEGEAIVLRGSLIEYLAYSGRTTRFGPLLAAFRPGENGQTPEIDAALKMAEIAPDKLNQLWLTWLRTAK